MAARVVCFVAVLALLATTVVGSGDKTLNTVSGPCKDQFDTIMNDQYKGDSKCADMIKKAMSTAPKSPADCPNNAIADAGSDVQKCMSKTQDSKNAWISFIKSCEVMNVNERTGAGEAEAAATATPTCFPRFNNLNAFLSYMDGKSATSAAGAARMSQGAMLLAAAAAGGAALLL